MYDFFICHATEDKASIARPLAKRLSGDYKVWYDEFSLKLGDSLRQAIDNGLKKSRYGIVIFSKNFFTKEWTQKELDGLFAKEDHNTKVILPLWHNVTKKDIAKFSPILAERFAVKTSSGMEKVVSEIVRTVKIHTKKTDAQKINNEIRHNIERGKQIPFGGSLLSTPCYFPSVSSVKARLDTTEYLHILDSIKQPLFLVSAYDIYNFENCTRKKTINKITNGEGNDRKKVESQLRKLVKNKRAVILDSGNYEGFWHKDDNWNNDSFGDILKSCGFLAHAFCFDKITDEYGKIIKSKSAKRTRLIINEIERKVLEDQDKTSRITINPIVHATEDILPEVVSGVVERLAPVIIAVPERELGDGILKRAETVLRIRNALDLKSKGQGRDYYPLHLLGTGNPLSILIYSICGADSFDGLEWCQTTVDYNTALLYHFQQRELFGYQSGFSKNTDLPYNLATWAHNLLFYQKWMGKIQNALNSGKSHELTEKYLPNDFLKSLKKKMPEIF